MGCPVPEPLEPNISNKAFNEFRTLDSDRTGHNPSRTHPSNQTFKEAFRKFLVLGFFYFAGFLVLLDIVLVLNSTVGVPTVVDDGVRAVKRESQKSIEIEK